ncbi:MAG: FAD-dependent oxidoreductase [Microbacterium sp.]
MSGRVTVVGAGVVGLCCALELVRHGREVRVIAADAAAGASAVAASLWAPADVEQSDRVRRWAYETLARLRRDAGPASGVREQLCRTIGLLPGDGDPWMRGFVPPFAEVPPAELPDGYAAGVLSVVPLVDTTRFLPWLAAQAHRAGVRLERRRIDDLAAIDGADVVVNATGQGSAALVGDDLVRPGRGQTVRLENPGIVRTTIVRDGPLAPLFVVPRFDDVVVGGPTQEGSWDTAPDPALEAELLRRAVLVEPSLLGARIVQRAVGLRPLRPEVRLEAETIGARTVVHCYGHGGAGVALCWGTAREAAVLAVSA